MTAWRKLLHDAVLILQLGSTAVGLTLYVLSFYGYGYESGAPFIGVAFGSLAVTSILTALRDRQFFLKNWGFGLMKLRQYFPFQLFPARRIQWLNPIGWFFMLVLLLHFVWLATSALGHGNPQGGTGADLRYVALMITSGGVLAALSWTYPPTELPKQQDNVSTSVERM